MNFHKSVGEMKAPVVLPLAELFPLSFLRYRNLKMPCRLFQIASSKVVPVLAPLFQGSSVGQNKPLLSHFHTALCDT